MEVSHMTSRELIAELADLAMFFDMGGGWAGEWSRYYDCINELWKRNMGWTIESNRGIG